MVLPKERIENNYQLWISRLQKYGCFSQSLIDKYGELIKNASYGMNTSSGAAGQGTLLEVVLHKMCTYAFIINSQIKTDFKVDDARLIKILLLQHISKSVMYVPKSNTLNNRLVQKNMYLYDFNENLAGKLRSGERSAFMCFENGITLDAEEFEAIKVMDADPDDKMQAYCSPLSSIIKAVNTLVNSELWYLQTVENKNRISQEK